MACSCKHFFKHFQTSIQPGYMTRKQPSRCCKHLEVANIFRLQSSSGCKHFHIAGWPHARLFPVYLQIFLSRALSSSLSEDFPRIYSVFDMEPSQKVEIKPPTNFLPMAYQHLPARVFPFHKHFLIPPSCLPLFFKDFSSVHSAKQSCINTLILYLWEFT